MGALFIEYGHASVNKHDEILCGDSYALARDKNGVTIVLSDGLGSGVKANILSTLTATILSTIDGNGIRAYSVEIVQTARQLSPAQKSMVIRVTDPVLLEKTGGIVQGMSGSPILQNGRIVGAVTHVFVDDPTRGYGLYIEWMLQTAQEMDDAA